MNIFTDVGQYTHTFMCMFRSHGLFCFFSIMGRGPGAFQIRKSGVNYLIGKFVIVNDYSKKTN